MNIELLELVREPVITEKSGLTQQNSNTYCFVVDKKATKPQIKKVLKELFNVNVLGVNTVQYKVRTTKDSKGRVKGVRGFKKAYVKVQEGQSIDINKKIS